MEMKHTVKTLQEIVVYLILITPVAKCLYESIDQSRIEEPCCILFPGKHQLSLMHSGKVSVLINANILRRIFFISSKFCIRASFFKIILVRTFV